MAKYISRKIVPSGFSYKYRASRQSNVVLRMRRSIFSSRSGAAYSRHISRSVMSDPHRAVVHPARRELVMYESRDNAIHVRRGLTTVRSFYGVTPSSRGRFDRLYSAMGGR